jgi:hypothetical protein
LAIFLLMQTRVKSKKTCKPGQEDVTSQPFDLTARGECMWCFLFTFLEILEKEPFNLRNCFQSKSYRNIIIDIRLCTKEGTNIYKAILSFHSVSKETYFKHRALSCVQYWVPAGRIFWY